VTLGVTVGKFYPFHLGHDHLIRTAKAQVDRLVVVVGHRPDQELGGELRAGWIRESHPDVEVVLALEDIPEAPGPWAERTLQLLDGAKPDLAFTSEDYGPAWAEAMGARHVCVDPDRATFPASGTQLRADLRAHWDLLTPPAKAHFVRRVRILGAESTGTTTLAQALAERLQTAWVPEYGRAYWEGRQHQPGAWDGDEFRHVAQAQLAAEDALARRANQVLICDTDALATHAWRRSFLGEYDPAIAALADARTYALTILTVPDFPFVQDGTREEPRREVMHRWFTELLDERRLLYLPAKGPPERRLEVAAKAIEPLRRYLPLAPP
jgi:NadR type nicotinamide-nucleotide adenylyltransferase